MKRADWRPMLFVVLLVFSAIAPVDFFWANAHPAIHFEEIPPRPLTSTSPISTAAPVTITMPQKNTPAVGDAVTFRHTFGIVEHRPQGTLPLSGILMESRQVQVLRPPLLPGTKEPDDLPYTWQQGHHVISFFADPANSITEKSEQNNLRAEHIDALLVGFWVERSVYNFFDANQYSYTQRLGIADEANSWEDWRFQYRLLGFFTLLALDLFSLEPVDEKANCETHDQGQAGNTKSNGFHGYSSLSYVLPASAVWVSFQTSETTGAIAVYEKPRRVRKPPSFCRNAGHSRPARRRVYFRAACKARDSSFTCVSNTAWTISSLRPFRRNSIRRAGLPLGRKVLRFSTHARAKASSLTSPAPWRRFTVSSMRDSGDSVFYKVLTHFRRGAWPVIQEVQGFLISNFALILKFQTANFLFAQFLAHLEPGRYDTGQTEGELPVQVNIHPLGIFLLGFYRRNSLYHY